jgi:putative addiction module component (TIGR02574 family)
MSTVIRDIEQVALSLPVDSRAELANKLFESLDDFHESEELRNARIVELRRRVEKIKAGTAELVDSKVAHARIEKLLQ